VVKFLLASRRPLTLGLAKTSSIVQMEQLITVLPFLLAVCIAQSGAPSHQQAHVLDATISHPVHLRYLLPSAHAVMPDTHWPLILYLHGGSLRGEDVEQLRTLGLPHKLESEPNFPFVVVSPQCPAGEIWTDAEALDGLLDRVIRDYRIDQQRIYVTGHSMRGRGALYFAYSSQQRNRLREVSQPLTRCCDSRLR
jgi:poly(3-hydroxybutyrate) depolymerase